VTITDSNGLTWTVTQYGSSTFLLTRPGAVQWATKADLERGLVAEPEKPNPYSGLTYKPERRAWVRS
jgi:hypothetical protein